MAIFLHNLTGSEGTVTVPALGAVVGIMSNWTLRRPEEAAPGNPGAWTLRAYFSYVNDILMNDDDIRKKVVVTITKNAKLEVQSARFAWDGNSLVMEESELCRAE